MIVLSENFRALFYAPFYAAYATGAFRDAGVEVVLRPSPDPPAAARALRSGEVDVMWGGPLRVMIVHDSEPDADLVCFADVVARDPFFIIGAQAAARLPLGRSRRVKFASVSEVPTPWICLADDLRRAGVDLDRLDRVSRTVDGRERRGAPRRHARRRAGLPALCRAAFRLRRRPRLVRRRHARPHRLHHAGDAPRDAGPPRRRASKDDPRPAPHPAAGSPRTPAAEIARLLEELLPRRQPTAIFAAAIERYRGSACGGPTP